MSDGPGLALAVSGGVAGAVSAAGLWAYSVFVPRCQFWGPVIRSLPQRNAVALTFEDGPDEVWTPRVLDVLAGAGVKGTFFVIGQHAKNLPGLIKRMHVEGHAIGNHSLDHRAGGWKMDREYWDRQIGATQEIVAAITGQLPVLFRPPMGYKTRHIAGAAAGAGLPIVGWSVEMPRGEDLAERVLGRTTGHDILLMHDGLARGVTERPTREAMVAALPGILEGIREKKLEVVSMVEALVAAGDEMRAQGKARLPG